MKIKCLIIAIASSTLSWTCAFQSSNLNTQRTTLTRVVLNGYVPDGFTKESYAKFKAEELKKKSKKGLGGVGPKGFQSRSFQSFQESLERGEAKHLMPVFNAKERVARGELKVEDIPYMQRGGNWDNRDVKGAKKVKWNKTDKSYAAGGYKNEQSVSIFGKGAGLDWTGKNAREGPNPMASGNVLGKNYKPPNVKDIKKKAAQAQQPKKKGFFGLF